MLLSLNAVVVRDSAVAIRNAALECVFVVKPAAASRASWTLEEIGIVRERKEWHLMVESLDTKLAVVPEQLSGQAALQVALCKGQE